MLHIAEARISRGWSQEQLARAVGTTQQTIQRWETGQTDPQIGKVRAISAALGVTMSYLLGVGDAEYDSSALLSHDEQRLLELYRRCSPTGKVYAMQVVETTAALMPAQE